MSVPSPKAEARGGKEDSLDPESISRPGVVEDHIPATSAESPATSAASGIAIQRNVARNCLEIRFGSKPAPAILAGLKLNGWRWEQYEGCWYTIESPRALDSAARILGEYLVAPLRAGYCGPAAASSWAVSRS